MNAIATWWGVQGALAQDYVIKEILPLTPPTGYSTGSVLLSAINEQGEVVGASLHSRRIGSRTDYWNHAILWRANQPLVDLGVLGSSGYGPMSYASDINDQGQIVGHSTANGSMHPFLWQQGVMTDLWDPLNPVVFANAINNAGVIVGDASAPVYDMRHAYRYVNGQWQPLVGLYSGATDINNAGRILGWAKLTDDEYGWWIFGDPDDPQFIVGDLLYSRLNALNEQGDIAGSFGTGAYGESYAVLYRAGQVIRLDPTPHPHSSAVGINDFGVAVGFISNRATMWHNGQTIDLNTLVSPSSGWELNQAVDINNKGWIIGTGLLNGAPRGFVLIPVQPDINADGCVDDADLLDVLFAFGQTGVNLPADLNVDGIVDDADLLIVLFHFGGGC